MPGEQQTSEMTLVINGVETMVRVRGDESMLETLRETLGIHSVRGACGIGICGTCTVLVDGKAASSCLLLTRQAAGRSVTTSEGLVDEDGELGPVQKAFVSKGAYQCSFCIPAMVLTVHAYLEEHTGNGGRGDIHELREYLGGNLCRCGSYPEILDAAADLLAEGRHG
jgi:aerobic-type carbon monoxide dehydrogenase small subunit (CoxS/CutS family)